MECAICGNSAGNKTFTLKEMMFGFRDSFNYFQCSNCHCMQIEDIPPDLDKYYPADYYSFVTKPIKKINWFGKLQFNQLTGFNKNIFGRIASYKYRPPHLYEWCKHLGLINKNLRILDIGCGNGELLRKLYNLNYKSLTGVDPFIEKDIIYNKSVKIFKKEIGEMDGEYDIIMLHHALEHMPNQKLIMEKVFGLLANSGKVLVRIPVISDPLMQKYGVNVVSLDPPRHLYIHSLDSIKRLITDCGFKINQLHYDAAVFDIIASEQYVKDISINAENSYMVNRKKSIFTKAMIQKFKKEIEQLNKNKMSPSIALYLEKK